MKSTSCLFALASFIFTSSFAWSSDLPSGVELLERSISYHDPEGVWGQVALALVFEESRPDGTVQESRIGIDIQNEIFTWSSQRDGHRVAGRLQGSDCEVTLDGSTEFSAEDTETYRLSCDRILRRRDYYTYLWGLPMKLRDVGTRIDDEVGETDFKGRGVLALRVTYDEPVGGDTWYFYFDPSTAALVGYRFFHDESKNDGEYITLEGEVELGALRLPETRSWYYNEGGGYLGTDTLLGDRSVVD